MNLFGLELGLDDKLALQELQLRVQEHPKLLRFGFRAPCSGFGFRAPSGFGLRAPC